MSPFVSLNSDSLWLVVITGCCFLSVSLIVSSFSKNDVYVIFGFSTVRFIFLGDSCCCRWLVVIGVGCCCYFKMPFESDVGWCVDCLQLSMARTVNNGNHRHHWGHHWTTNNNMQGRRDIDKDTGNDNSNDR